MGGTSNSHSFLDNFTHSCNGGFGDFESKIMRIKRSRDLVSEFMMHVVKGATCDKITGI